MDKNLGINQRINLDQYLSFGGSIDKIDINNTHCQHPEAPEAKLVGIKAKSQHSRDPIYELSFANGQVLETHGMWVYMNVKFVLASKYK